ncbi:MAG: hypothetical protein QNJ16_04825 [Rhodobacter sp.]|nr:hypothetical protein [Rhodobacter sp.]
MTRHNAFTLAATVIVAAILPLAAAMLGVSQWLGAHPWWAGQTAWVGVAVGLIIGLLSVRRTRWWRIGVGVALIVVSAIAAGYGKAQFAASFAEDAFAGRLWYFGWIGIAAGVASMLLGLLWAGSGSSR